MLLQPSVSGVAVSLLVSELTVDILNTFCDGFMVQYLKLVLNKFLHLPGIYITQVKDMFIARLANVS